MVVNGVFVDAEVVKEKWANSAYKNSKKVFKFECILQYPRKSNSLETKYIRGPVIVYTNSI